MLPDVVVELSHVGVCDSRRQVLQGSEEQLLSIVTVARGWRTLRRCRQALMAAVLGWHPRPLSSCTIARKGKSGDST